MYVYLLFIHFFDYKFHKHHHIGSDFINFVEIFFKCENSILHCLHWNYHHHHQLNDIEWYFFFVETMIRLLPIMRIIIPTIIVCRRVWMIVSGVSLYVCVCCVCVCVFVVCVVYVYEWNQMEKIFFRYLYPLLLLLTMVVVMMMMFSVRIINHDRFGQAITATSASASTAKVLIFSFIL